MKKAKIAISVGFLVCLLVLPFAGLAEKAQYQTFERQQFKVEVLKNWKRKVSASKVVFYPKKSKKTTVEIKKISLSTKGQKYLKAKNAKKFASLYKKKIEKEYKQLNVKFKKAEKYKISNYKVIHLWFSYATVNLNEYYITDGNLYYRITTKCIGNCALYTKDFKKTIKSFRVVEDTIAPVFAGATGAVSDSTSSMTISWTAASDNVSAASKIKYLIYQANQLEEQNFSQPNYTTIKGATSYTIGNLPESTSYYFVVRAQDESGNTEANTAEVIATTKAASNSDPAITDSAQLVTYKSNGSNVAGLMYRPSGTGPFPAIVFNHGGVDAADPFSNTPRVLSLSEGGKYVVLATAYRGDIGSEGTLSLNMGDINDILAAIEYLKSKSYVDANRIGTFGESRGGANTLLVAERSQDLKAAVSWYPYTNIATYCKHIGVDICTSLFGGGLAQNISKPVGLDYLHVAHIASAINHADRITTPLQNSHGTADPLVPYSQSEEFNAAMAGKTNYTFYPYEGADHGGSVVWLTTATDRRQQFFGDNL